MSQPVNSIGCPERRRLSSTKGIHTMSPQATSTIERMPNSLTIFSMTARTGAVAATVLPTPDRCSLPQYAVR